MVLRITGLNELRERLERMRPEEVMARALAEQAKRMAERVREGLSEAPGAAGHDEPWLKSGALRNSVGTQADGLQAAVGSSDAAAVPQELGTAHMPARPFLAPVAADMGEEVARAVGAAVAAALRGNDPDASSTDANSRGGAAWTVTAFWVGAMRVVTTLRVSTSTWSRRLPHEAASTQALLISPRLRATPLLMACTTVTKSIGR